MYWDSNQEAKRRSEAPPVWLSERKARLDLSAPNTLVVPWDLSGGADRDPWYDQTTAMSYRDGRVMEHNDATYMIDGDETLAAMMDAMKTASKAPHFIYLIGWFLGISFPLIGPDTNNLVPVVVPRGCLLVPFRRRLARVTKGESIGVARAAPGQGTAIDPGMDPKRLEGIEIHAPADGVLVEQDDRSWVIDTSLTSIGRLFSDLGGTVGGVQIRAMLWDQYLWTNTAAVDHINALPCGGAILDNRTLRSGFFDPRPSVSAAGTHHQKALIVNGQEGLIAFVGGVDINPDRRYPVGVGQNVGSGATMGSPMHDVHCRLRGPAALEVLKVFHARWNDHPSSHVVAKQFADPDDPNGRPKGHLYALPKRLDQSAPGRHLVQIGCTFGNGSKYFGIATSHRVVEKDLTEAVPKGYGFAPTGEQTARRMFLRGIAAAKRFVYFEDQYMWNLEAARALRQALTRLEHVTILVPHFSAIAAPEAERRQREFFNEIMASEHAKKVGIYHFSPPSAAGAYVHTKTWIFDDEFAIIGSANCNRRSWTHDSEIVAGICDGDRKDASGLSLPHRLRIDMWADRLGMTRPEERAELVDGVASVVHWQKAVSEDRWVSARDGRKLAKLTFVQPNPIPYDAAEEVAKQLTRAAEDWIWNEVIDAEGA